MFDYSPTELKELDEKLEPKLAWAKERKAETQQLALDATRLLSCTEERLDHFKSQGFFRRCWGGLLGKTGEMQRANQKDLAEMQKAGWRYLGLLQERNLMLAHSMLTVKNNLLTLAVKEDETRKEIERMANKVYERFCDLEDRMDKVEVATAINGWLLTLEARDFDEKYPESMRLLALVRDFDRLKENDWSVEELRRLQIGVKQVGLPWKESVRLADFISNLVDEIEEHAIDRYQNLIRVKGNGSFISEAFVLDQIAVPSYVSLYEISDKYADSSDTIDILAEQYQMERGKAIKTVIKRFIERQGVDLTVAIPLRDLAVELLHCARLSRQLYQLEHSAPAAVPEERAANPIRSFPQPSDEVEASPGTVESPPPQAPDSGCASGAPDAVADFERASEILDTEDGDKEHALGLLQRCVEWGYAPAKVLLGVRYLFGDGVEEDESKAVALLQEAANEGDAEGTYFLGACYENGLGVEEDDEKASECYRTAAEADQPDGLVAYARFLENGIGVKEDIKKAIELYKRAVELGDAEAMYELGLCYLTGSGVDENEGRALDLFMRAMKQDHIKAKTMVGRCYCFGLGVNCDVPRGLSIFEENSDKDAESLFWLAYVNETQEIDAKRAKEAYTRLWDMRETAWGHRAVARLFLGGLTACNLHVYNDIPAGKLNNAIGNYGNADDIHGTVLSLYDGTFWGSAKEGLYVTPTHIYSSKLSDSEGFSLDTLAGARIEDYVNIATRGFTMECEPEVKEGLCRLLTALSEW